MLPNQPEKCLIYFETIRNIMITRGELGYWAVSLFDVRSQ